ncbi:MAG: glutamine amidotransferase-related protein, partial [Actinomycetota bacterium]
MTRRPVLVVDLGAQYAKLIARRVRECHVYSEVVAHTITAAEVAARRPAGIILSGGPASVYEPGSPGIDRGILDLGVPVFGICYGHQLMARELGGEVAATGAREYGATRVAVDGGALLRDLPAVLPRHQLGAVADAEHRDAEVEDGGV